METNDKILNKVYSDEFRSLDVIIVVDVMYVDKHLEEV